MKRSAVTVLPGAIKELRRREGISQARLASLADVSEGLIAQIETGRRQPGIRNALAIAKALEAPVHAIAWVHIDLDEATPEAAA